eukprot:scaffold3117_cov89-Cylindrotheca_fusiformis.AAC.2
MRITCWTSFKSAIIPFYCQRLPTGHNMYSEDLIECFAVYVDRKKPMHDALVNPYWRAFVGIPVLRSAGNEKEVLSSTDKKKQAPSTIDEMRTTIIGITQNLRPDLRQ